jgi:hypothetical protein
LLEAGSIAGTAFSAAAIAADLAVHFVQRRDPRWAVQYLHYAGENALQRSADQEAITHLTHEIERLERLPDTVARPAGAGVADLPRRGADGHLRVGHDPGVCCRSHAAEVVWFLGYPDQAVRWNDEALALGIEYGFPYHVAVGTLLRDWPLATQRKLEEGIAQLRQRLAALRATGTEHMQPQYGAVLMTVYNRTGQAEAGLSLLAPALALVETTGGRILGAELYRLRGELLLQRGGPDAQQG